MGDILDELLGDDGPVKESTVEEYVRMIEVKARNAEGTTLSAEERLHQEMEEAKDSALPVIFSSEQEMNERFVYVEESDKFLDLRTGLFRTYSAMENALAASKVTRDRDNPNNAEGAPNRLRLMALFPIWSQSPIRRTVTKYDFAPAHSFPFFTNANLEPCVNSCKPSPYALQEKLAPEIAFPHIKMFVDHLKFLCMENEPTRIHLQFLAHSIQKPEERVNWLLFHSTPHDGVGRGWIGRFLQRMFPAQVICTGTFEQIYAQKFNRRRMFARFLFAEEVSEKFSNKENFHQFITEEMIVLEPKGGEQFTIGNFAHKIGATNKPGAIAVEPNDRRVYVIDNPLTPHPGGREYYDRLYTALQNPDFLTAAYQFLNEIDISAFDATGRAPSSKGTAEMHERALPEYVVAAIHIAKEWPSRAIKRSVFRLMICQTFDSDEGFKMTPEQLRFAASMAKAKPTKNKVQFSAENGQESVYILPGGEHMHTWAAAEIRNEVLKGEVIHRKRKSTEEPFDSGDFK
jgi:hypothetical protein